MNSYGLDARYFKEKLGQLVRDADNYTPAEMQRALNRLASASCPHDFHFFGDQKQRRCAICDQIEEAA
jgi:hypothetical protein